MQSQKYFQIFQKKLSKHTKKKTQKFLVDRHFAKKINHGSPFLQLKPNIVPNVIKYRNKGIDKATQPIRKKYTCSLILYKFPRVLATTGHYTYSKNLKSKIKRKRRKRRTSNLPTYLHLAACSLKNCVGKGTPKAFSYPKNHCHTCSYCCGHLI